MVIGAIIGEKNGGLVYIGEPGPLSEVKAQFRAIIEAGGEGCSQVELISTRGRERRARFNPLRKRTAKPAPEAPADPGVSNDTAPAAEAPEPTETLGDVAGASPKPGKKSKKD